MQSNGKPLKINGGKLKGGKISIDGSVSSQYLSALLMIAPKLKGGLEMHLTGKVASVPYLNMTLRLMEYFGANTSWTGNVIKVEEGSYTAKEFTVEADWSGASYWFEMAAFAEELDLSIKGLKEISTQGDSAIVAMYDQLGVQTDFFEGGLRLSKNKKLGFKEQRELEQLTKLIKLKSHFSLSSNLFTSTSFRRHRWSSMLFQLHF